MGSSESRLTPLQSDLLAAFFEHTQRFFLTGGGALAAYYLHHRDTRDLDLFASGDVDIAEGVRALAEAAVAIGATARILQESGDFKRFSVSRGEALTLVDLVIDRAPQVNATKAAYGKVLVDQPGEIAANKLCALLDRTEVRDLVDLKLLLASGLQLSDVVRDAQRKHMGADPATLAWVLSQSRPVAAAVVPEGMSPAEIDAFREELIAELTRMAVPKE